MSASHTRLARGMKAAAFVTVIATGLVVYYPWSHTDYAETVARDFPVASVLPDESAYLPGRFPPPTGPIEPLPPQF